MVAVCFKVNIKENIDMLKTTKCVYQGGALSAANLRVKTDVSFNPIKSINIVQMNYFNYI